MGYQKASISKWCSEFSKECRSSPEAKEDYDNFMKGYQTQEAKKNFVRENLFLKAAFFQEID